MTVAPYRLCSLLASPYMYEEGSDKNQLQNYAVCYEWVCWQQELKMHARQQMPDSRQGQGAWAAEPTHY